MIADTPHTVCGGDVLFVSAEKQHRLVAFTDDLTTWAIFWGSEGANPHESSTPE
jgi:hypothetical protein